MNASEFARFREAVEAIDRWNAHWQAIHEAAERGELVVTKKKNGKVVIREKKPAKPPGKKRPPPAEQAGLFGDA